MEKLTPKELEVGKTTYQKGCFTKLKQIAGASLPAIELRLGFRHGRLSQGAYVVQARELPKEDQFDLIGYTSVPADAKYGKLNHDVLKKNFVIPSWQISGPDSLVKVIPIIEHSDSETYPFSPDPVAQYLVNELLLCRVVAFVPPNQHFRFR